MNSLKVTRRSSNKMSYSKDTGYVRAEEDGEEYEDDNGL